MHEMNRLSDDVADAAAGQVGGDDERLQHQLLLAEQGHLPAMVATSAASAESSASSLERVAIAMAEEVLDEPAAAALMWPPPSAALNAYRSRRAAAALATERALAALTTDPLVGAQIYKDFVVEGGADDAAALPPGGDLPFGERARSERCVCLALRMVSFPLPL